MPEPAESAPKSEFSTKSIHSARRRGAGPGPATHWPDDEEAYEEKKRQNVKAAGNVSAATVLAPRNQAAGNA
jgi:hypothetical protein